MDRDLQLFSLDCPLAWAIAGHWPHVPRLLHVPPDDHMTIEQDTRRVLVAAPNGSIRDLLRLHLPLAGYRLDECGDGRATLDRMRSVPLDLVVIELGLPIVDGPAVCRAARAGVNRAVPILVVSSACSETERVLALEAGADDCLAGPFGVQELLARTKALLRRVPRQSAPTTGRVTSGVVAVDARRRQAIVRGRALSLTRREFDLLYLLAGHPGIVYSRTALLSNVKGDDGSVTERTIDTLVSRLRRKVELNPQQPELILTAWGVGYKFTDSV
jgi:DNA-binding response OmpR family regulator